MVDAVAAQQPLKPFTEIKYMTKEGETISATKNNGIVTLNGDKNGIRQMPLDQFLTQELPNAVPLVRTPEKDTVEIGGKVVDEPKYAAASAEQKPEAGTKLDVAA